MIRDTQQRLEDGWANHGCNTPCIVTDIRVGDDTVGGRLEETRRARYEISYALSAVETGDVGEALEIAGGNGGLVDRLKRLDDRSGAREEERLQRLTERFDAGEDVRELLSVALFRLTDLFGDVDYQMLTQAKKDVYSALSRRAVSLAEKMPEAVQ